MIRFVLIFVAVVVLLLLDLPFLSFIGALIFLHQGYQLFVNIGKTFPIRELTGVIACLQWIVGPILSYKFNADSQFYYMAVHEQSYMEFVVPAVLAYLIGLNLLRAKNLSKERIAFSHMIISSKINTIVGYSLFFIGAFAQIFKGSVPATLAFLFVLIGNLCVIGALYLFIANVKYRWSFLTVAILFLIQDAAKYGVFHDLLIWGTYIFFVISIKYRVSILTKLVVLVCSLGLMALIQGIKVEYRLLIEDKEFTAIQKVDRLADIFSDKIANPDFVTEIDFTGNSIDRFNQGWIVSRILDHVPAREPFANGATIMAGLESAFIPRILKPDKMISGGRENILKYAGMHIAKGISMDLGLIGEAYANFNRNGGILFMFLIGIFFNFLIQVVFAKAYLVPTLPLWIPFLFFYIIKAEIDFATVINQVFKSFLVLSFILFVFWNYVSKSVALRKRIRKRLQPTLAGHAEIR